MAVIAISGGVRVPIWMIPEPSSSLLVRAARYPSGEGASDPQASATQQMSRPSFSASRTKSSVSPQVPFGEGLNPGEGARHRLLELPQPDEDDLLFLVRHLVDRDAQAGPAWPQPHPLAQRRSGPLAAQGEPPCRARLPGIPYRPREHPARVVLDDVGLGRPFSQGGVLAAPEEPRAHRGLRDAVQPFDGLEFLAQARHQPDVGDQPPDAFRRRIDPGRNLDRRHVGVTSAGPLHQAKIVAAGSAVSMRIPLLPSAAQGCQHAIRANT
jgi:hypothetical protein